MSGRTIVVAVLAASLLIILLHDLREAGFAADRLKRIQELEAREVHLYEQLAQKMPCVNLSAGSRSTASERVRLSCVSMRPRS